MVETCFLDCHGCQGWKSLCATFPAGLRLTLARSNIISVRMYVCVSYLTVTSSVNITTRCVMEQRVAVTACDPTTELIFRHAGSVELVTR